MADLVERARMAAGIIAEIGGQSVLAATVAEVADALEAARGDACVSLVVDIRWACGDKGKRMHPQLVEFIRELTADAERYRWLADARCDVTMLCSDTDYGDGDADFGPRVEVEPYQFGPEYGSPKAKLDAAIDAAKEVGNG